MNDFSNCPPDCAQDWRCNQGRHDLELPEPTEPPLFDLTPREAAVFAVAVVLAAAASALAPYGFAS